MVRQVRKHYRFRRYLCLNAYFRYEHFVYNHDNIVRADWPYCTKLNLIPIAFQLSTLKKLSYSVVAVHSCSNSKSAHNFCWRISQINVIYFQETTAYALTSLTHIVVWMVKHMTTSACCVVREYTYIDCDIVFFFCLILGYRKVVLHPRVGKLSGKTHST